jgi:long-chain acyl-CoA synthetase
LSSPVEPELIRTRPASLAHLFRQRVASSGDAVAYLYPVGEEWRHATWAETGGLVDALAAGLIAIGVAPEEPVAIMAGTRFEWILADLAIMCAGAATTTIYPTTVDRDVVHILNDCGARVVIAEDDEQVLKLWRILDQVPRLARVVQLEGQFEKGSVLTLEQLVRIGRMELGGRAHVVDDRVAAIRRDQLATIMYTSGTTGTPKGVRLRHSSWTYEGAAIASYGILDENDLQFLWLPLSHSFGKVLLSTQLAIGFPTAIDGRVERIIDNLPVLRPTFMGAAPRIFEKAYGRITAMTQEEGGVKKLVFDQAFAVARRVKRYESEGKRVPFLLRRRYRLLDKLVFAKIRERFGGRLRFFISGAAALNTDIAEFFELAGVIILEGYGLTETSAGSCVSLPDLNRIGYVGQPFPGTEIDIAPDGEILISGPGVMDGYHNLAAETHLVLKYGWLYTGDIGHIDSEGRLRITDRKKDFFKTDEGEYVAPTYVEGALKAVCPYAGNAVVIGSDRPHCVAVVALDPDAITQWAEARHLPDTSYDALVRSAQVHDLVAGCIEKLNAKLNPWETIKEFVLADADFTVASGELTPSLKVKRNVVEQRYAEQIALLYPVVDAPSFELDDLTDAELSEELATS